MYAKHYSSDGVSVGTVKRSRRAGRQSRRYRNPPVSLEIIDDSHDAMPLRCFDLSAVGVYLHSPFLLRQGDEMKLRIRVPDRHRPIDVLGEVVRVETGEWGLAPGMGIAFREIAESDSAALKQFLLRRFLSNAK